MEKIELYLGYVGFVPILLGPVAGLIVFMMVPRPLRMGCALAFMMVWLVMGNLVGLQPFQAIARVTGFAAFLLLALTASMHPGPRRKIPPMAWGYIIIGLFSYLFILTVRDLPLAMVIRTQWLTLVIAALAVARTVVDEKSLMYVFKSLTAGFVLALLLPLSDVMLHPGEIVSNRRFNPYEANSNHIGVLFALTAPFCLYMATNARTLLFRLAYIAAAAAAAGMGLLTASRSTMIVMVGMAFPVVVSLTRRPILTAIAGSAIVFGAGWFLGQAGTVNLERLKSLETGRVDIAQEYMNEVISERPVLGLLQTSGESFIRAEAQAYSHTHNAYLEMLYLGGIVYALPKFILVLYTLWCVVQIWLARRRLPYDRLFISFLAACMVMTYAHGMVNHSLDYPTTLLSFTHILLSVIIMALAHDASHGTVPTVRQAHQELEWADLDYEDAPAGI
jgi:hypothetical protein